MFKIINKQVLAPDVKRLDVIASTIARKIQPGQFVSVCPEEDDDPIPLPVTGCDPIKGAVSLIFAETGPSEKKLGALQINESIFSVLGPLGCRIKTEKRGVVACVATGIGIGQMLPICRAYKDKGNKIIGIIGAKTKKTLMLEPQMRLACYKLIIGTNDGSYGRRGLATELLEELLSQEKIDCVYAIGSVDMMRSVCDITGKKQIKTFVKLNPVMTDCVGMCGSCRVKVDGKTVLACVEGPEFDGHKVDFDDLAVRMNAYKEPAEWASRQLEHKANISESKIFTRFLSDILKR